MEQARGNRKVLPNYLLDDYVPAPDSKVAFNKGNQGNQGTSSQSAPAGGSLQHGDNLSGRDASTAGEGSDAGVGPLGFMPRRKKKLRQACVYCRRSHLVCEEKRPCYRCVKRGIADRCVDPPQESGALLQDGAWPAGAEASSSASSGTDAFVSPPPPTDPNNRASSSTPTSTEASGPEGGSKRKRKAKSDVLDPSDRGPQAGDPHAHLNRSRSAFEFANGPVPYHAAASQVHSIPSSHASAQESTLSHALPPGSAPFHSGIPISMPIQPDGPGLARAAPSQLLQGQPIFQPPSSAELDSLFSTYFFDVADAFNTRQNVAPQQQSLHPVNSIGPAGPMLQAQQPYHPQHSQRLIDQDAGGPIPQSHPPHSQSHGPQYHAQHQHVPTDPASDRRTLSSPAAGSAPHYQQRPLPSIGLTDMATVRLPSSGFASTLAHAGTTSAAPKMNQQGSDGKEAVARQKPGDVYAPYPYRKGYASLMRYMTEQNWSEHSIKSVEAALAKVRRLWFSLEDNIQPSSMIQLQAEWAGNVRYFSESVLPFAPIPMVVCRKAGEVYASNQLAQELCGRSRDQMTGGKLSCYELMTESSASKFFNLYEHAVGGSQADDGSYVPGVADTTPLYWNAEIVRPNPDGSKSVLPTRGIFEMKIAPCGLPSLLVCCFVPLT